VGNIVQGHVWRRVVVDGITVIEAGAPMVLRISAIKKRKIAGRGGDVEISAVSVRAVDGAEIFLDGGYDKQGSHRTALSASLAAVVFWPAIFIRGKEAILEPGTIFDASIPADTHVTVGSERPRTIRLTSASDLAVEILYDNIDEKARQLPMRVTLCDRPWGTVHVAKVNDVGIEPIPFEAGEVEQKDTCSSAGGSVDLRALAEHFRRGINRFTLAAGDATAEVLLDIEM
jgi:hypothetical protein